MSKQPVNAFEIADLTQNAVNKRLKRKGIKPLKINKDSKYRNQEGVNLLNRFLLITSDEPERFDMNTWIASVDKYYDTRRPACGTIGCLAGWISVISPPEGLEVLREVSVADNEVHLSLIRSQSPIRQGETGVLEEDVVYSNHEEPNDWGDVRIANNARERLGITRDQAVVLFDVEFWPSMFRISYYGGWKKYFNRIEVTAERLQYWIDNDQ